MVIYILILVAFWNAFYIIGKNQMKIAGDETDSVPDYSSFTGAGAHVYLSSLGEFDSTYYF